MDDFMDTVEDGNDTSTDIDKAFGLAPILPRTYPLIACSLLIMTLAVALNAFVLRAVGLRGDLKENVKFLIRNTICADILLAFACGTRFLPLVAGKLVKDGLLVTMCLEMVYNLLIGYSALNQTFCSLAIAVDRLYSIWSPLRYHTMKYNRKIRGAILLFTWGLCLITTLPPLFIDSLAGTALSLVHPCYVITLPYSFFYQVSVITAITWAGFSTIVLVYLVVIFVIFRSRLKMLKLSRDSKETKLLNTNWSMTVTFLLVQTVYFGCYIPGIVMALNLTPLMEYFPPLPLFENLIILNIFMLNSVVDPLVYILRVKQIRDAFLSAIQSKSRN